MFWDSTKNKNKVSFLIDLRSSSIGYALVEENKAVSFIRFYDRKHIFFKKIEDTDTYINIFYQELSTIFEKYFLKDGKLKNSVDEIKILLGTPWYEAKYKNIKLENKNIKITQKYINDLINKKIVTDTGEVAVEKVVNNFILDGYPIENPFGKKANDLEFSIFESFISKSTKKEIESIIKTYFPEKKISYHSHPQVMFSAVKRQYPQIPNFMVFDIGGEITEINIVKNNKISNFLYIPMGSHEFVRSLINDCNYSTNTAFSALHMFIENQIDEKCSGKETELFKKFTDKWLLSVKKILESENISSTPSNIFIVADQEIKNIVKKVIDKPEGYAKSLKNNMKPYTRLLDYNSDEGLIKFGESKKRDTTMNIFCEFLRIHND